MVESPLEAFPAARQAHILKRYGWIPREELHQLIEVARDSERKCTPLRSAPIDIPFAAKPGTDGDWHLLDPHGGGMACSHGSRRRPSDVRLLEARPILAIYVPKEQRCPSGLDLSWPEREFPLSPPGPGRQKGRRPTERFIWEKLYLIQQGRCAACRCQPPAQIDHDHGTGLVRGLLCRTCNGSEAGCLHPADCFDEYRATAPGLPFAWDYPRRERLHGKRDAAGMDVQ